MVLILSSLFDNTTNQVIDWLKFDFLRRNNENSVVKLNLLLTSTGYNGELFFSDYMVVTLRELNAFWYRRDDFSLYVDSDIIEENNLIKKNLENEWRKLKDFVHNCCESKNSLGSHSKEIYHNKLGTLVIAQQIGFQIPDTLITTKISDLTNFVNLHSKCITKTVDNIFKVKGNNFFQTVGIQPITRSEIDKLDETVFPTLIQKKIEKAFELRIFYMKNQFYPMAIFSQNDEKTKLDYRNYNREKPNRNIPYILPKDIEEKLQKLMDKLDLDTGSIDMIVTPEGEYVFLEVNPTGQFGWVSDNCNYYLEEKIANYLQGEA